MVTVSSMAQGKLKEILEGRDTPDASVRIAVVRGPHGCVHGWNLAIEDGPESTDQVQEIGDMQVLFDSDLAEILDGATIDYHEDEMGIGFTIQAPNTPPPGHHGDNGGNGGCHH